MPYPSLGKVVSYTWATKPDPTLNNGTEIFISDVGTVGSKWRSNGTIYVPSDLIILHKANNLSASSNGTAEELLAISSKIPNGVLAVGRTLVVDLLLTKSGTSESTTNTIKIGTNANGITGANVMSSAFSLGSTNRQLAHRQGNVIVSETEIQNSTVGGSAISTGLSTSAPAGKRTITNIANDLYISITGTKTTGGIETVTVLFFDILLYP